MRCTLVLHGDCGLLGIALSVRRFLAVPRIIETLKSGLRYLQKSYKPDEWSVAAEPDDDWASSVVDNASRFLTPPRAFSMLPASKWKAKSNVA